MVWVKRKLRGTSVFARSNDDGSLVIDEDGRVEVRYKDDDAAKVYRAAARNLDPDDGAAAPTPAPAPASPPRVAPARVTGSAPAPAATGKPIVIYTDGGSVPNPGPMGIGVVILKDGAREEIGEYLGDGTNNIAELTAIERALDALADADRTRPILVHADSAYAIGVVSGAYKAKKNLELVARLRQKAERFPHLRFVKVAGHAGVSENERCDQLASAAIRMRR